MHDPSARDARAPGAADASPGLTRAGRPRAARSWPRWRRACAARRARGFSLVELLVSSSVLAVALLAAAASVIESSELEKANAQTRSVGPLLASLLDEVRATPFADVPAAYSGRTREVTGLAGSATPGLATWTVADAPGSDARWIVRSVTAEIRWAGPHGPQRVSAVMWISDRTVGVPPLTAVPVDPL